MNDDIVVSKILKLLENNTAFIGYALNGGVGTKINVRNTETGKTIQALSINVDSTGEVLVVKDSEDNQYKAVTFKTAEKVSEKIIQLRKTKPLDDKKTIEYTDSDIEVFYLFVKLIDTGSPVTSQLTSTWIRKGSSCTQFVGAYERCNYASKETIDGVSYTGLPYKPYETLQACLNDDTGRDAATPHGTKDENGAGFGIRIYSTKMTATAEQDLLGALTSHDNHYGTNMKKLFGYGSILECSGAMYVNGWEAVAERDPITNEIIEYFFRCDFGYFPGYDPRCTPDKQDAGYCTTTGFVSSKTPLFGQEAPGQPSVGAVDNTLGHEMGWVNLPYEFMYQRHYIPLYVNGAGAQGSFLILSGLNEDQNPTIPEGFFPWIPGCPANGQGGPYDGSGGNRFPDGVPPIQKRDMKLSTHKAEIWLGSSKKKEAIKLYELGASDLFSGMYNAFIIRADETRVDQENRLNRGQAFAPTSEEVTIHNKFYENRNKNRIDLLIDPRVWVYVLDNVPKTDPLGLYYENYNGGIENLSLTNITHHIYNRTINLSIIDKKTQVIHLKLGLKPANVLSSTDCKGKSSGNVHIPDNSFFSSQSWEYQKYVTIKVKDWEIESTTNTLDLIDINNFWNKDYISRKFLTSFGARNKNNLGFTIDSNFKRNIASSLILRPTSDIDINNLLNTNNYEQWNYSVTKQFGSNSNNNYYNINFFVDYMRINSGTTFADSYRYVGLGTVSWWELWNKTYYSSVNKRLNSVVGYELNYYQVLTSMGLNPNLDYSPYANSSHINRIISNTSYFLFKPDRPLKYLASTIKLVRANQFSSGSMSNFLNNLKTRETIQNNIGLNFYFSDYQNQWSRVNIPYGSDTEYPSIPIDNYYSYYGYGKGSLLTTTYQFLADFTANPRFDTTKWISNLWAQFIYEGLIKIDIDSYKEVEFNLYSPLNKYTKFTTASFYSDSEYSFSQIPEVTIDMNTTLSPGKLDIANKQVKMTKPTNVDLDPNMSFLVYLYPFVEVTKKKKTI